MNLQNCSNIVFGGATGAGGEGVLFYPRKNYGMKNIAKRFGVPAKGNQPM
jgi:hypothetical protein